ncbi:MAG: hypothetical protein IJ812_06685 [Schwartzia sp.]|nr:hypothetical protein [Schwartzia sp. (in: firmicutes)]MBR1886077.1 hypothetical protein [Schwartzia sp. (in: firmicutes)]
MENVTEDRSRLRRHVRAAREWLGRAEDSLDRAEDVRGDLNLMLARAELARAQETERPVSSVTWARRLAPLCAAMVLAGIGLAAWRGVAEEAPPTAIERRTEEAAVDLGVSNRPRETIPLPAIPQADAAPVPEARESAVEVFPAEEESRDVPVEPVVILQEAEEPAVAPPEPPGARLPSEEMQRLMNSAGQSLRATNIDDR